MIVLTYFILFLYALHGLKTLVNIKKSFHYLKNNKNGLFHSTKINKKIFILIPLFQETSILLNTIKYFSGLERNTHIEIFYITTQKEGSQQNNATLNLLLQHKLEKNIIHYPYYVGDKSHQLNYAFQEIYKKIRKNDLTDAYFAIFDADSRPELEVFDYILNDVSSEMIYQLLSIYSTNYDTVSSINQANSILQTRRTFSFEFPKLLSNFTHQKGTSLMYLIGHGLIIRGDIRKKFPFPENTLAEDIAYGYKMNIQNIFAKPLPFYDYCSVPYNYFHNLCQTARRFQGELGLYKEVGFSSFQIFTLIIKRYIQLSFRMFSGIVIFIAIILCIIKFQWIILVGFILFGYIDFLSVRLIINEFYLQKKKGIRLYICLLIRALLDCIGPLFGLLTLSYNKLLGKQAVFYTTPKKG